MSLNFIRFIAHHPRRWANIDQVPVSTQQLVWSIVLQLLSQHNILQSSPQLRPFAWNVSYFIQWHAVIHVLDTLRAYPLHQDAVKAWWLIDALYEHNKEILLSIDRPIYLAVGNLCLKAFSARVAALLKGNKNFIAPDYIIKLRKLRAGAKAKREGVISRRNGQQKLDGQGTLPTTNVDVKSPDTNLQSIETTGNIKFQRHPAAQQAVNPAPRIGGRKMMLFGSMMLRATAFTLVEQAT
jgi:hypothetical protein